MDSECVRPFPGIRPFLGGIFGPKMIVALEQVTALRIEFDWLDDKIIRTTTTTTTTSRICLIRCIRCCCCFVYFLLLYLWCQIRTCFGAGIGGDGLWDGCVRGCWEIRITTATRCDLVRGAGDFDTTTVQKERDHPEKIRGLCLVSSSKLNNTHCMVKTFYILHVYISSSSSSSSFRPFFNPFLTFVLLHDVKFVHPPDVDTAT